jgi:hypothetical protein
MVAFQDYKIAAGYDNAGGLVNIGTIIPASNILFPEPIARPNYTPGQRNVRGDGRLYMNGSASQIWLMTRITFAQWDYAKETWCEGGYSGFVTIRTRYVVKTYSNYNAVLTLLSESELDGDGIGYKNVPFTFTRLRAI